MLRRRQRRRLLVVLLLLLLLLSRLLVLLRVLLLLRGRAWRASTVTVVLLSWRRLTKPPASNLGTSAANHCGMQAAHVGGSRQA